VTSTLRSSDGRVVVPARLRQRRVEVRRNEGRRRLRRLGAAAVVVVVLLAGWAILRSPLLAVQLVEIVGSSHVSRADVRRATGIGVGEAMIDLRPGTAVRHLEALPWVATATVSRRWPTDVTITLTERHPIGQVGHGRSWALVDASGRVLERRTARSVGLPVLADLTARGAGSHVARSAPMLAAVAALPRSLRDDVAQFGYTSKGAVALTLAGDGVVTLGRPDGLPAKFASLSTMLDHLGTLHPGCTLDVSVPEAPTLTPEKDCA
jgi:cell division protein FtsQ